MAEGISGPTPEHGDAKPLGPDEKPLGPSEVTLAGGPGVTPRHGAIEVTDAGAPRICAAAGTTNISATTAAMYPASFIVPELIITPFNLMPGVESPIHSRFPRVESGTCAHPPIDWRMSGDHLQATGAALLEQERLPPR